MIIVWILPSGLMDLKPLFIVAIAPDIFRVFITRIAPVMIIRTSMEFKSPEIE